MDRQDAAQHDLLAAIVAALRSALGLDPNRCYLAVSAAAPPKLPRGGEYTLAVSGGESVFVPGEQAPGNCTEHWSVWVTIYTRVALDRTDEDEAALVHAERGLLTVKRQVLAALVGKDIAVDGQPVSLRQLLYAKTATAARFVERPREPSNLMGVLSIQFGVDFDWDLAQ